MAKSNEIPASDISDELLTGKGAEAAMGPEPKDDPVRKDVANYRPSEGEKACEGCANFVPPEGCTQVLGQIEASGVCDLWEVADTEDLLGGGSGLADFMFGGGGMEGGAEL